MEQMLAGQLHAAVAEEAPSLSCATQRHVCGGVRGIVCQLPIADATAAH